MKNYKNIIRFDVHHKARKDIRLTLNDPGAWNYSIEKIFMPFYGITERYRLPIYWHLLECLGEK